MTFESKPVTREEARRAVEEMLGRSKVICAATLAEAVAQAERSDDLMVGINSLWAWFCALPPEEQAKIGKFDGKYAKVRLWASARFQCHRK